MKKSKLTENEINGLLKKKEKGWPVQDICREHSISPATLYD
jgi:putative transposase